MYITGKNTSNIALPGFNTPLACRSKSLAQTNPPGKSQGDQHMFFLGDPMSKKKMLETMRAKY